MDVLKALLPVSLAAFIGATVSTAVTDDPRFESGAAVSNDYSTLLTPSANFIAAYWAVILLLLLGQIPFLYRSADSGIQSRAKRLPGYFLPLVNVGMAAWTVFWSLKWFISAQLVLLAVLVVAGSAVVQIHCRDSEGVQRGMAERILVELPTKMILGVLVSLDIWQNALLALGYFEYIGQNPSPAVPSHSIHGVFHAWLVTGLVLLVTIGNVAYIVRHRDPVWTACSSYLAIALVSNTVNKPEPIIVLLIASCVTYPVALLASIGYERMNADRIRLSSPDRSQ